MNTGLTITDLLHMVEQRLVCIGCESPQTLIACRNCHKFVCAKCRKDHTCGSGDNPYQFKY